MCDYIVKDTFLAQKSSFVLITKANMRKNYAPNEAPVVKIKTSKFEYHKNLNALSFTDSH